MTDFPKLVLPGDEKAQTAPESRDAELEAARAAMNAELELRAAGTAVPQAAPVEFAPRGSATPTLTLNTQAPIAPAPPEETRIPEVKLSPEEQQVVEEFANRIDITDSSLILGYGAAAQQKISKFTESALDKVRTHDLGEAGELMTQLMGQLKGFTDEEPRGFFGMFRKAQSQVELMKARYDGVQANVDKICDALTGHQIQLMKDIAMFDKMYEANLDYYRELSMYIEAGRLKLRQTRNEVLPELQRRASQTGLMEDAQAANDLANMCGRFEKKLFDLDLTRNISIQMAPQIRLLQNNDQQMAEKIQSTLANTIPLWKNQMVLSLGLEHSRQAMEAQRAVTNMTNELLRKNAERLKMGSIETAKEAERGIVDIETLKYTTQSLINTLDEVLRIQQDGAQKRQNAERELRQIEGELKQKMLEMRG